MIKEGNEEGSRKNKLIDYPKIENVNTKLSVLDMIPTLPESPKVKKFKQNLKKL